MASVDAKRILKDKINSLLSVRGKIKVPTDFRDRANKIHELLDHDYTGIVATIYEYMIATACVNMDFECSNDGIRKLFLDWKDDLNKNVSVDVPKGLNSFTNQYFRERWKTSLIVAKGLWNKNGEHILPNTLYLYDGASVTIEGGAGTLGGLKYKVGEKDLNRKPRNGEQSLFVRKPYNSWYEKEPTPYFVKKGTLYHSMFKRELLMKQAEIIEEMLPHLLTLSAGSDELARQNKLPGEGALTDLKQELLESIDDSVNTNAYGRKMALLNYTTRIEQIIPEFGKFMNDGIYSSVNKDLFASLGLVELEGFSNSRKETILNPKVLKEEIENSVIQYTELIQELVDEIREKNNIKEKVYAVPGVVRSFLTERMITLFKELFDRGQLSHQDFNEAISPFNFEISVARSDREKKGKISEILTPHARTRAEVIGEENSKSEAPEQKENKEDKTQQEQESGKKSIYNSLNDLPKNVKELPTHAQQIWLDSFNDVYSSYEDKLKAKKIAMSNVKKMYYQAKDNTWKKRK